MRRVGMSSGAMGLKPMAKSLMKGMTPKKGAAVIAGTYGTGAMMRRRKSGLDSMPGRPTGIRNY